MTIRCIFELWCSCFSHTADGSKYTVSVDQDAVLMRNVLNEVIERRKLQVKTGEAFDIALDNDISPTRGGRVVKRSLSVPRTRVQLFGGVVLRSECF